jgi:hypothetical protein
MQMTKQTTPLATWNLAPFQRVTLFRVQLRNNGMRLGHHLDRPATCLGVVNENTVLLAIISFMYVAQAKWIGHIPTHARQRLSRGMVN